MSVESHLCLIYIDGYRLGYRLTFGFQTQWLHCITVCRTCSHCIDLVFNPYSLFLCRTGIGVRVCTQVRLRQCKWAIRANVSLLVYLLASLYESLGKNTSFKCGAIPKRVTNLCSWAHSRRWLFCFGRHSCRWYRIRGCTLGQVRTSNLRIPGNTRIWTWQDPENITPIEVRSCWGETDVNIVARWKRTRENKWTLSWEDTTDIILDLVVIS